MTRALWQRLWSTEQIVWGAMTQMPVWIWNWSPITATNFVIFSKKILSNLSSVKHVSGGHNALLLVFLHRHLRWPGGGKSAEFLSLAELCTVGSNGSLLTWRNHSSPRKGIHNFIANYLRSQMLRCSFHQGPFADHHVWAVQQTCTPRALFPFIFLVYSNDT